MKKQPKWDVKKSTESDQILFKAQVYGDSTEGDRSLESVPWRPVNSFQFQGYRPPLHSPLHIFTIHSVIH